MKKFLTMLILLSCFLGCGESDNNDSDSEIDTDSDTGEIEIDCSDCTDSTCLGSISGKVILRDGNEETPLVNGNIQTCITNCNSAQTNEIGEFVWYMPDGCKGFNFEAGDKVPHINVRTYNGIYTEYAMEYTPTQEEVGDQYNLNTGIHYLYKLPNESYQYNPSDVLEITDIEGLSFSVKAGDLGPESLEVKIFKFPLNEWKPPFLKGNIPDVLYYVEPYFERLQSDVSIKIQADNWTEGDTGNIWFLGDFKSEHLRCTNLENGGEDVKPGQWVNCESANFSADKVTGQISRFGWFGIIKD